VKRRGYSLVEVLVAAGIGLMILLVLGSCWSMASRAWAQARSLSTAQSSTLQIAYRMRADYTAAMPGSLQIAGNQISFLSDNAISWDQSGTAQWSHWVQYRYTPSAGTVERRSVALAGPVTVVPTGTPPIWSAGVPGTLLGDAVTLFAVSSIGPGQVLTVHLGTQSHESTSRLDLGMLPQLYGQD
jgi:type II secretory pathway pseudopilin PulG